MPPNIVTENCSDHIIRLIKRDVNQTILPKFSFNSVVVVRINILIPHLPPDQVDPEEIKRYDLIVFFNYWQQQMYNLFLDVPYSNGIVMRDAIDPIVTHEKPRLSTNILYAGNMDKGLDIVLASFKRLTKRKFPNARLIVCTDRGNKRKLPSHLEGLESELISNTKIDWYRKCDDDFMRGVYYRSHIFAYPTDYPEVSYTPLIRAMSASCFCLHSSYGSLPETSLSNTSMYGYDEDRLQHANKFTSELEGTLNIYNHKGLRASMMRELENRKSSIDDVYNWKKRSYQWNDLLLNLLT